MKSKIGLIDLFIDEWHANNYPAWFRQAALSDRFELALAWEEAPADGKPLAIWCAEMGMTPASSLSQVVEQCDALCVLAPSNPEVHERLSDLALRSGKPVYVDKPFAPDRAAAERMFRLADQYGTPLMSSSALRYSNELLKVQKERLAGENISFVETRGGGGNFSEYVIHQVEMITALLGCGAKRVRRIGCSDATHVVVEYIDHRQAHLTFHSELTFGVSAVGGAQKSISLDTLTDFFPNLIAHILEFFESGKSPIPSSETIEVSAIVAAMAQTENQPDVWINVL